LGRLGADGYSPEAGTFTHGLAAVAPLLPLYGPFRRYRTEEIEPLVPKRLADWLDRRHRPLRVAPWQDHSPINTDFARLMAVDERAREVGHDFLYRVQPDQRATRLTAVDYAGDWFAAEKAVTGVEVRDPTADIDVITYCLGVPTEQYLVEGIDRSLIRRAMWGRIPEKVLTNRLSGLQVPDWHEHLEGQRDQLMRQVTELSSSALVRRIIDVGRLENALKNWPAGGWHSAEVFQEYNLALTRGVAASRFLRWFESGNDVAGAGAAEATPKAEVFARP
jgi:asparagine synthase (glutamine-hydrolysing)